jgi:hypothetical protein
MFTECYEKYTLLRLVQNGETWYDTRRHSELSIERMLLRSTHQEHQGGFAMDYPKRTARDEYYINSTSFEVYMIVGAAFLIGFTLIFVLSVVFHFEPWIWPGGALSMIGAAVLLRVLSTRERLAKIREVDGEE